MDDETTIIISLDITTKLVGNFHGPYAASPADPDEVNSPCVRPGPKAKRKLFVDELETGDKHSNTAAPPLNLGTTYECPWKLNMDNQPPSRMDPA
ncbi:hypothetical protein SASPL_108450 [Salvia splendens]|uniref:Uncharacterized protein n=1 Tax=Salvia splendens TaxID=180675 RepID=A0A8X8YI53_SALSN|nr:hypothetical protein SASPL_108450 [Salvia splendens]